MTNSNEFPTPDNIPRCTYRLQLRNGFGFTEAAGLACYLAELGVSHCYTSPFFMARPGSSHGYDVVNPNAFNPEIGDETVFKKFVREFRAQGLFLLVDVVPNHMGIMGSDNHWWLDVLENGPASVYASFFDIDWQPVKKSLRNRILVPVLGDHYGRELEAGRLQLLFDAQAGTFAIHYFEHLFPLDPRTYPLILRQNLAKFIEESGELHPDLIALREILELCGKMPRRTTISVEKKTQRRSTGKKIKEKLAHLATVSIPFRRYLDEIISQLHGESGKSRSFIALHQLLERQVFRLSHWKVAAEEINYRRFFDINDLAALRVERNDVFAETHNLLLQLAAAGDIDGLRIDHIDGLYDPAAYLRRLQGSLQSLLPDRQPFLVVEKILGDKERLPADWATHGTTGYDFCAQVTGILLDSSGARKMERIYRRATDGRCDFVQILHESKKHILLQSLAGELNTLANRLDGLSEADWQSRDFTFNSLRLALIELVAAFPVYRTYIAGRKISKADRQIVKSAVELAKSYNPDKDHNLFDFIAALLLQRTGRLFHRTDRKVVLNFSMQFQQLTAPVMAKGLEDTAFYRYTPLVSVNEVGSNPANFELSIEDFHQSNRERLVFRPHSMLATSTHDSKRSEDVRARLNVLSEMVDEWHLAVSRWRKINRGLKQGLAGRLAPDANEEYLLYQSLLGIWPLAEPDRVGRHVLQDRVAAYMLKAAREAKCNTSWHNPDEKHEQAIESFVMGLFAERDSEFWRIFLKLHGQLAPFGLYNSLSQVLLKMTVPGVPDIYQGCELWNFSLVDPDNRLPVDFSVRREMLAELAKVSPGGSRLRLELASMLQDMTDGRIKLFLIWRCLQLRCQFPEIFHQGEYQSLQAVGDKSDHVISFVRHYKNNAMLVIAPRFFCKLVHGDTACQPLGDIWEDTWIEMGHKWRDRQFVSLMTDQEILPKNFNGSIRIIVGEALRFFPVQLYMSGPEGCGRVNNSS